MVVIILVRNNVSTVVWSWAYSFAPTSFQRSNFASRMNEKYIYTHMVKKPGSRQVAYYEFLEESPMGED